MLPYIPLSERVLKTSSKPAIVGIRNSAPTTGQRPSSYRNWPSQSMSGALDAVAKGTSVRKAAEEHGIPKSTLWDHVSGRVISGAHSGPSCYLSTEEEAELERFLLGAASIGYPRSRLEVMAIVGNKLGKPVTSGWWESFCRRHPRITLHAGAPLSKARAIASDPCYIMEYFDVLEQTLKNNELLDKPQLIFNMDETGVPLSPKGQKGVHEVGSKNPITITSGDKTQITVVACVSAAGYCLPPMVIWDRKTLSPCLTEGEVPGTIYGLSSKGWMDQELFDLWFNNHFLRYVPSSRPLLLLMDGHSSHYCPETIRFAAENRVILFTLPPNTTHISQPLDKGCFGPFKLAWKDSVHKYMVSNPGKVVTRYAFSPLFREACMKSMTVKNILSAFKVSGVYPLDRSVIKLPGHSEGLQASAGISYIPLLTPSKKKQPLTCPSGNVVTPESSVSSSGEDGSDMTVLMPEFEASSPDVFMPAVCTRALHLEYPSPVFQQMKHQPKMSCHVLTSKENLDAIEEKQGKKEETLKQKVEKKLLHEEKRRKGLERRKPILLLHTA